MTKLLVMISVLGLAMPSFAAPAPKAAPAKPKCGDKFVVDHKEDRATLTQAQVDEVVKAKLPDVTACWHQLPADQRKKTASAVLKLAIDDGGEVQTVDVDGLPDDAARCIAKAAVAWVFPQTDGQADAAKFSYPLTLAAN
jgi:hypothetical protein